MREHRDEVRDAVEQQRAEVARDALEHVQAVEALTADVYELTGLVDELDFVNPESRSQSFSIRRPRKAGSLDAAVGQLRKLTS